METLGSTMSAEREGPGEVGPRFALHVAMFADRPLEVGTRHVLDVDEVLVGRGGERSSERTSVRGRPVLVLRFRDPRMSTLHARLLRCPEGWVLTDQQSKNGTRVAGEPVERAVLRDGDVVELGGTFLVVRTLEGWTLPTEEAPSLTPLDIATLNLPLESAVGRLAKVARSTISVVLMGESGTGKEVFARAVHAASGRTGPFQAINCGALPSTLLEAELFGCKKGAFSGAVADREGLVRSAEGGTLLLDEIGDLPLGSQAALLRVLQEHEVMPVGGTRAVPVDVRVLAATHKDLGKLVATGTFREDLLARLSGFELRLPPLRERIEDLGLLVGGLLRRIAPERAQEVSLTRRAARALFAHAWPQNVRELEKALEAALVFAGSQPIDLEHLPAGLSGPPPGGAQASSPSAAPDPPESPEDARRRDELRRLLEAHRGNLSAVARELGKARFQVQRWMKRYALRPEDYR